VKSEKDIRKTIKALRTIIDTSRDTITMRMAYFAETTLRYFVKDVVDWKRPEIDLRDEVEILRNELYRRR